MELWDALNDDECAMAVNNWNEIKIRTEEATMNYIMSRSRDLAPKQEQEEDDDDDDDDPEDEPASLMKLGMQLGGFFGRR